MSSQGFSLPLSTFVKLLRDKCLWINTHYTNKTEKRRTETSGYLLHATLKALILLHRLWGLTVPAHGAPRKRPHSYTFRTSNYSSWQLLLSLPECPGHLLQCYNSLKTGHDTVWVEQGRMQKIPSKAAYTRDVRIVNNALYVSALL